MPQQQFKDNLLITTLHLEHCNLPACEYHFSNIFLQIAQLLQ